jgi:hypothetical protein
MTAMGQKRPKLLRLPVAKSATRGMGNIVPFPDILHSSKKPLFEHFIDTGERASFDLRRGGIAGEGPGGRGLGTG